MWTGEIRLIKEEERRKDVRRYAEMEAVVANTIQAVWTIFKVVLGRMARARAQALAARAGICAANMKMRRVSDLVQG